MLPDQAEIEPATPDHKSDAHATERPRKSNRLFVRKPGLRSVNRNVRGYSQNERKLSVQLRSFRRRVANDNYSQAGFWHSKGGGLHE